MLTVTTGHASRTGKRPRNEDFVGMVVPDASVAGAQRELEAKGIIAAIADGVSGAGGGREAAEYTVRGVITDYYATPDTWETARALDRVIAALNRWVMAQGQAHAELNGMATTLTALVLRGQRFVIAHIGDTRCYRWRNGMAQAAGSLDCLTEDHVWERPDMRHVLRRAIGLDAKLHVDYVEGELTAGDRFVLLSDGVWASLKAAEIAQLTAPATPTITAQASADALCDAALAAGSTDNVSAIVIDIVTLGANTFADLAESGRRLPLPPKLKLGQELDGLVMQNVLHESRASLLYTMRESTSGRSVVLKTLAPLMADDAAAREAFAREEWLARRIVAPQFPQYLPRAAAERSHLYFLMSLHGGITLQQALDTDRHFSIPEVVALGVSLLKGVSVLHRLAVLHRDIKPGNIHLGTDGQLRLLDLGVSQSASHRSPASNLKNLTHSGSSSNDTLAGTPSFLAPEQFEGAPPTRETDLYAVAVTLYHTLTRRYPYGEIEPFQRPRFSEPTWPTKVRREIPQWLENVLLKGVCKDPALRFGTCEEFVLALERGDAQPLPSVELPLAQRDPLKLWQWIASASVVMNLLLLYLLLVR